MTHPVLTCCLYLSLQTESITLGPWQLVQNDTFPGPWLDDALRDRVQTLLSRLDRPAQASKNITLIVSAKHGADGEPLGKAELTALQAAIDLGVISMNPVWDQNAAAIMATSDNTQMHCWPLAEDGSIAFDTGGIVPFVSGGWDLNKEGWSVPFPIEAPRDTHSRFNSELATAIYEAMLSGPESPNASTSKRRLITAVPWWSKAWRNTPSITMSDRVIFLKTAFEALTGESSAWKGARALREHFEQFRRNPYYEVFQPETLLWSPDEQANRLACYRNLET